MVWERHLLCGVRTSMKRGACSTFTAAHKFSGYPTVVKRKCEELVAEDCRRVAIEEEVHLALVESRKIICVHFNCKGHVDEYMTKISATPRYFYKPIAVLWGYGAPCNKTESRTSVRIFSTFRLFVYGLTGTAKPGNIDEHDRGRGQDSNATILVTSQ